MIRAARCAVIALVVHIAGARVAVAAPIDTLATDDPRALADAVAAIEHAPPDAGTLFAAARACEEKLADPARALALYERVVTETPNASVATPAGRRAQALRAVIGEHGEHAAEARKQAQLVVDADRLPPDEVVARGDALAAAPWPGAASSALWLAEWLRRTRHFDDAQARYAAIIARWPGSPTAALAQRGAAGCAIEAHDWDRADALASQLPSLDPVDRAVRDELVAAAAHGRHRGWLYTAAWFALFASFASLIASLLEAAFRGGALRPSLVPPTEIAFLAPIAAVLVGVAFTAHRLIAPAVAWISVTGVVLAWLSGTTLDLLRTRARPLRTRALFHVLACTLGILSIGYIALTRDGLLDLLVETVRFGPDAS